MLDRFGSEPLFATNRDKPYPEMVISSVRSSRNEDDDDLLEEAKEISLKLTMNQQQDSARQNPFLLNRSDSE